MRCENRDIYSVFQDISSTYIGFAQKIDET